MHEKNIYFYGSKLLETGMKFVRQPWCPKVAFSVPGIHFLSRQRDPSINELQFTAGFPGRHHRLAGGTRSLAFHL